MGNQQGFKVPSNLVIQLEIVSEEEHDPDSADIEEVSREMVDSLRENGYVVEPAYTGTKGIPIFDIIIHVSQFIHDNQEWIAATLSTASVALQYLMKVRDRLAEKEKAQRSPLEITLYVNGQAVSSDANSLTKSGEHPEGALPEAKGGRDSQGNAKIQVRVPKKKHHYKR
jgi:hypothetical protein